MSNEQNILTAHGAKLITKKAIEADLEAKRNIELTETDMKVMDLVMADVRTAAEAGNYTATVSLGQGMNPPQQIIDSLNKVSDKLVGLGYETSVFLPARERNYNLSIAVSWKKD